MNAIQELHYLEIENSQLRADNARLRNVLAERDGHARRIKRAHQDALLLALWAGAGIPPSRRFAGRHKMSERRWENAVALLRMARILTGNRRWATRDAAIIEARLETAAQRATESETAYRSRHMRFRKL